MALFEHVDIDPHFERMEKMSRVEIFSYVLIVFLALATVAFLLYVAASYVCQECTFDEKTEIVKRHVASYLSAFA